MITFDEIYQFLKNNQFASGGLLMVVFGGIVASLRRVPIHLWNWSRDQVIVTMDVAQNDPAFNWLVKHFDGHASARRIRSVMVNSMWNEDGHHDLRMGPAVGKHLIWDNHRPIWVDRMRKDLTGAVWGPAFFDTFRLQTIGRSKVFLTEFLARARKSGEHVDTGKIRLYVSRGDSWNSRVVPSVKRMDSVVLADDVGEKILADAKRFTMARAWYEDKAIPYRRGYLLYGPPGCGKTSLILALAVELDCSIYMLSTGDRDLSDQMLYNLVATIKPNSLLVIEDVDAAFRNRAQEAVVQPMVEVTPGTPAPSLQQNGVTFSGLLNSIDGILGGDGRILLMTTNHPDRLDPALMRPGRVDLKVELGKANKAQAQALFVRFFPGNPEVAIDFAASYEDKSMSPAELQELFLRNVTEPAQAIRDYVSRQATVVSLESIANV